MDIEAIKVIGTALIATFGILGPAIAIGWIGSKGMDAMGRNPDAAGKIAPNMVLAIAFAEALGILALVVAFVIMFV
ncbi:ATP synthase F0 subunit C [Candidatus Kaiserbacteria bacterium]|nr:ATP synthase F0 subunit C [Candidatus Kaiserbacteria bacterium]